MLEAGIETFSFCFILRPPSESRIIKMAKLTNLGFDKENVRRRTLTLSFFLQTAEALMDIDESIMEDEE